MAGQAPAAPFGDIADSELEAAFEAAEARTEEMIDANDVAEAAIRRVEEGAPEGVGGSASARAEPASPAQTAAASLAPLRAASPAPLDAPSEDHRRRVIATLERWLENLQRETR